MGKNRYRYDAVDNILGITNADNPTSLTKLNKAKLGGRSSHTYEYDELNRLVHANGKVSCYTSNTAGSKRIMKKIQILGDKYELQA